MGANASAEAAPTSRQTLYDLLGVEQVADALQLKRAYRRMALELHPDRNFDNTEEATTQFAKVQAAYDILTDPQERQWYDAHLDSFEYSQYNPKVTRTTEVMGYLYPEFTRTLDPQSDSMYRLVTEFFERLKHEEMEAAFEDRAERPPVTEAPQFGHIDSPWNQVKGFYDVWSSFSTVKAFAWEDLYPAHQAGDRRTRRNFEARNRRVREAARREFSKAVRTLVAALRQIDVRVQNQRKAAAAKRAKASSAPVDKPAQPLPEYRPQEWENVDETAIDTPPETLECIACEQSFDSAGQLRAHELTPRHTRAVHELRRQMLEDDSLVNDVANLGVDDIVGELDRQRPQKPSRQSQKPEAKAPGKAKKRRRQKNAAQGIVVRCGTCETEFDNPNDLQSHKQQTRH